MSKTMKTASEILAIIEEEASTGYDKIVPFAYSSWYGRAATAAAFKMAKAKGIIEVAYMSMQGTPVYRGVVR